MAATQAKWGKGTLLQYSSDSGVSYTSIPEITSDIMVPRPQREKIDVSHHESPNERRESILGWIPESEIPFTINWLPSNAIHQALMADYASATLRDFKVIWTDDMSNYATFQGYVSMFNTTGPLNAQNKAECSITIAGAITDSAL